MEEALRAIREAGGGPGGVVPHGAASGLTKVHVLAIERCLQTMAGFVNDRSRWMMMMSAFLMSKCKRGGDHCEPVRRSQQQRRPHREPEWEEVLKYGRTCNVDRCKTKSRHGCRCDHCGELGVIICKACFKDEVKHDRARGDRRRRGPNGRAKKAIPWGERDAQRSSTETISPNNGPNGMEV